MTTYSWPTTLSKEAVILQGRGVGSHYFSKSRPDGHYIFAILITFACKQQHTTTCAKLFIYSTSSALRTCKCKNWRRPGSRKKLIVS